MQNSNPMSPSGFQGAAIILISLGVFIAAILMTLSATGGSDDTHPSGAGEAALGHVHGLGVDPEDDTLYIASHFGVFRVTDGEAKRVADRWQDTMGFAIVGPQHFIASGHPDVREDLPAQLGLIESTDGAETWQSLSLQGESDLHAIEPTEETIYAIDAAQDRLIATEDRRIWRTIDTRSLLDLAVAPNGGLLATTPDGDLLRYEQEGQPTRVDQAPQLTYIDSSATNLVGVTAGGDIYVSSDGDQWNQVGAIVGEATALNARSGAWYVATDGGIFSSTDAGRVWNLVVETL